MKRYRILQYDFDTRAHWLSLAIADGWELKVKQMHWQNYEYYKSKWEEDYKNGFIVIDDEEEIRNE